MDLITEIIERAKANKQRIVLPEGTEERTLKAANLVLTEGIADLILLGNPEEIKNLAKEWGLGNIHKATIIDPDNNPKQEEYAQLLYELRKKKGMTIEEARKLVLNPLYLGCLIIKSGDADGQLAGARNTTGDVLRPALQIIKTAPGITCVSGAMLMLTHAPECGDNGVLVMGDVAVTPVPDANQLAQIAVCTAQTAKAVAGLSPRVAMLSFSTKGSAKHEVVDKVVEALKIAKEMEIMKSQPRYNKYPIELEKELITYVQMGDKNQAKLIINRFLSEIFSYASGDLEIVKAKLYEFTAFLSRSAVEAGAPISSLTAVIKKNSKMLLENSDFSSL